MLEKPVLRVKELSLCRFRGFVNCEPITLDTNADVILLTGPNGFGKTSLIDALCLLLTGHCYPERRPLTSCTKPPDANCSDSAKIQVVVEYEGSEEKRIDFTIRDGQRGDPEISPRVGFPDRIPPELAARSSFFYQDLLSKLFEEEDAQAGRLLEFLTPLPRSVTVVEEAVKKARTQWKEQISGELSRLASVEGFPSEDAINEDRKRAASAFRTCWYDLVRIAEAEGLNLPQRSEGWLLLLKSDNLRAGWERELRNLAADCLSLLLPDRGQPSVDENPSVSLRLMGEAMSALRDTVTNRAENAKEKIGYHIRDLPDDTVLLAPETWAGEEQEIATASEEANRLQEQLFLLEKLERHFDNPGGPNLLEVLAALRDQGRLWLDLPETGPDLGPPSQVFEWLQEVVAHDLPALTGQLEDWQDRITNERLEVRKRFLELQKLIQSKKTLLEKSRKIYELSRDLQLQRDLGDVWASFPSLAPVSQLKIFLGQIRPSDNLTMAIERVQEAIAKWIQIEELDEQRKAALQQKAGYEKSGELIDSIGKALEQEAGRNSVLKAALLPPDEIIKDLEHIVNEILDRFRLVNGICPVRFETKRVKGGKGGQSLRIYTADRRPLNALSTGQKAQLGLSTLLGLNYALHRYICHSVIALDDVTTAFDMAQLPRTAALIRQIAYVTEEPLARRQVFIVSHHEDLTNRLLDFLIPPEGRELRILNFIDWSLDKGPVIDERAVIPGLRASPENRKKFADTLKSILNRTD